MKSDVKKTWVRALRSGKYVQTEGTLKCDEGHCCLGVLTELHSKKADDKLKWTPATEGTTIHEGKMVYGKNGNGSYPPKRVLTWAGLHHTTAKKLANMNDDQGMSFKQIADYIEENL